MSWKPIMHLKLERVCSKNDTPTYMQSASNQRHSYEQVTNRESAELLLHMKRGRSVPKLNFTPACELLQSNPCNLSVSRQSQVSDGLVVTPLVATCVGNNNSISNNRFLSSLQLTKKTVAETSNDGIMTTIDTPTVEVGRKSDSSINSMITPPSTNNNGVINNTLINNKKATPANGNPMNEKEKTNNPLPPVPISLQTEKPITNVNDGGKKPGRNLAPSVMNNFPPIANETQSKGETEKQKKGTKALFPANRGLKEGDDPLSVILGNDESKGKQKKGSHNSYFCHQEHNPTTIGDNKSTICTAVNIKELDKKNHLNYYQLTHQICSVKSKNCIFVSGKYPASTDWSTVSWKHIWYCNTCAIRKQEKEHDDLTITSMCSYYEIICQEKEDIHMSKDMLTSQRQKSRGERHMTPV